MSQRQSTKSAGSLAAALCAPLFVLALLAGPAAAADPVSCRVIDPELRGTYVGDCVDDLAEGTGQASGKARYEGGFKAGRKHGRGVKTWPTGDRYEGEFKEDRKHGQGRYTWGAATPWAGESYSGAYHDDRREGPGTYSWPDGERYTGTWHADAVEGVPTGRMMARTEDQRVRQAAVSKSGLMVCRRMLVGSVVHDWLRGVVEKVDGAEIEVRIVDPGQFDHRVRGEPAGKGAIVRDWALMWTPCR